MVNNLGLVKSGGTKHCNYWKVGSSVHKNCFFGTEKTRTSTSTKTSTSTSTATTKTSTSTSTSTAKAIDITTGLIDYWAFNGNMYDSIKAVTSTVGSGAVTYVADRKLRANSAVNFNSFYMYMANSPNPSSIISAVWWMYETSQPQYQYIFECPISYSSNTAWPYIAYGYGSNMYLYENGLIFMGVGSVTINTWTHVAIVHTGSVVNLYIGGNVVYTVGAANPSSGTGQCCFGVCDAGNMAYPIKSYLDDFYIYSISLNSAQVNAIMNTYN